MKNYEKCQWQMNKHLIFLMVIIMVGFILNDLDFAWGFQKCIILWVLEDILHLPDVPDGDHDGWGYLELTIFCLGFSKMYKIWLSGISMYLEDILDLPDVPDGNHDGWGYLEWTRFCLRFPKMYNTWSVIKNMVVRNLHVFGGHPWSSWCSWWWSWWLGLSWINLILPEVSKNV